MARVPKTKVVDAPGLLAPTPPAEPPKPPKTTVKAPPFPTEAFHYFARKKINPHESVNASWKFEHAAAFRIAKELRKDVLTTIHDELTKALARGDTFQMFAKNLRPYLAEAGWWPQRNEKGQFVKTKPPYRLRRVFETNMRQARAAQQEKRILRQAKEMPFLRYELGPSQRHRDQHVAWAGVTLPVGDPWWDAHMPMNAWGCKCTVIQMPRVGTEVTDRPEYQPVQMVNKQTGEIMTVDKGIHPDFNGRPSKLREDYLRKLET